MNTIKVRDIEIGAGAPKIIVPIVGVTKDDIIAEAKTFDTIPVDMVEWRVDWFENVFEFDKVEEVLKELRDALGNIPILMTFRTSKEGGEKAIEPEAYARLNIKAAQTGYVDFVDVEIFTGDEIVKKIIDGVHAAGARVIASNHDFFKTPAQSDIVYRLRKMQIWVLISLRLQLCHRISETYSHFCQLQRKWLQITLTDQSSQCQWQAQVL